MSKVLSELKVDPGYCSVLVNRILVFGTLIADEIEYFKIYIYLPRDNFSPESGGRVKSRTAMEEISRQGTIKL